MSDPPELVRNGIVGNGDLIDDSSADFGEVEKTAFLLYFVVVLAVNVDRQVSVGIPVGDIYDLHSSAGVCQVDTGDRNVTVVVIATSREWRDLHLLTLLHDAYLVVPCVRATDESRRDCSVLPLVRVHHVIVKVVAKCDG